MKKNLESRWKLTLSRETLIDLGSTLPQAVEGGAYSRWGCTAVGTRVCTSADC